MNKATYVEMMGRQCEEELKVIGIPTTRVTEFVTNSRATGRVGCCHYRRHNGETYSSIDIADTLCDGNHDRALRSVLYHELIHTVDGCQNHGKTFDRYAGLVGDCYGVKVTHTTDLNDIYTPEEIERVRAKKMKYAVKCRKCGVVTYRQRKVKLINHPEYYRCALCGGEIARIK